MRRSELGPGGGQGGKAPKSGRFPRTSRVWGPAGSQVTRQTWEPDCMLGMWGCAGKWRSSWTSLPAGLQDSRAVRRSAPVSRSQPPLGCSASRCYGCRRRSDLTAPSACVFISVPFYECHVCWGSAPRGWGLVLLAAASPVPPSPGPTSRSAWQMFVD